MIIRFVRNMVSKVIIVQDGAVLLLERSDMSVSNASPWTWDLPGGHLDAGETFEQAAIREVFEETKLILAEASYVGRDKRNEKITYFYTADEWSGNIRLSEEHKNYRWVKPQDLALYKEQIGSFYYEMILNIF